MVSQSGPREGRPGEGQAARSSGSATCQMRSPARSECAPQGTMTMAANKIGDGGEEADPERR